jgi:CBS domain-containing protein
MAEMTCGELMTRDPAFCLPDEGAERAARLMKTADVGSIPVVDDERNRKLVGIVTDRDLAMSIVAEGKDPKKVRIRDVMTPDPVACREGDDVDEALDLMAENQVRRIPIVDGNDALIGIIAQADIATRLEESETGEMVEEISESPGREEDEDES